MFKFKKTISIAFLASAALMSASAAQAQVAGIGAVNKINVIMGAKAFKDGYNTIQTQNAAQLDRIDQLQGEIDTLSKPLDSNGDGQLGEQDQAWASALQLLDTTIKSLDRNKDGNLTGTELDELRAKNLPAQQILQKQREISAIQENLQLAQLYVVDSINKQYNAALQSVVTAKKLNIVLAPGAIEWAPKEVDITAQVVAALDRAVPAVAYPAPEQFSTSQEAINLRTQIERILISSAVAQARAQAAQQQQQGGQQPAQPAAPAPQGPQPDSR